MNQEKIIGKFFALTYDNQILEFIVKDNGLIYCDFISKKFGIKKLYLKPNFEFTLENDVILSYDTILRSKEQRKSLIGSYHIDTDLAQYLILNRFISYSYDMAELYGFNPNYASDKSHKARAFKHVKDPKKRLLKQRQGQFN